MSLIRQAILLVGRMMEVLCLALERVAWLTEVGSRVGGSERIGRLRWIQIGVRDIGLRIGHASTAGSESGSTLDEVLTIT